MKNNFKRALLVSLPVFMGYFPAGVAFGVLATKAGFPWWLSMLTSLICLAGSAQYAAIPLIASGQGVFSVGLNTFGINLRHIFYALPLLDSMPKNKFKRAYCLFTLTDECFSVMTTLPKEEREGIYVKAAMLMHSYWVVSTGIGILITAWLSEHIPNLDFAMACLFMVLWYEQIKQHRKTWPVILGIMAFFISITVLPQHALMLALTLCVISILVRERMIQKIRGKERR